MAINVMKAKYKVNVFNYKNLEQLLDFVGAFQHFSVLAFQHFRVLAFQHFNILVFQQFRNLAF